MQQSGYYAFISYSHQDMKWAKWLQGKLEAFKLPTTVHNELDDTRYLRPIFRDETDLNTGNLGNELTHHLEQSRYLLVICSKNAARSHWMSQEVKHFIDWGRVDRIIPIIIDDTVTESFPQSLAEHVKANPADELLGISIKEVGREKAFIRVVSRMLEVSFDSLWQRHKREMLRRIIITSISIPVLLAVICYLSIPVRLNVTLTDEGRDLPHPDNAVLTVNGVEYDLTQLDTTVSVASLPGYWRLRSVDVAFRSTYYEDAAVSAHLGIGVSNSCDIQLHRDNTFGLFAGKVMDDDGNAIEGAEVAIKSQTAITGADGTFSLTLPIEEQEDGVQMTVRKEGYVTSNEQCWASDNLGIILREEKN